MGLIRLAFSAIEGGVNMMSNKDNDNRPQGNGYMGPQQRPYPQQPYGQQQYGQSSTYNQQRPMYHESPCMDPNCVSCMRYEDMSRHERKEFRRELKHQERGFRHGRGRGGRFGPAPMMMMGGQHHHHQPQQQQYLAEPNGPYYQQRPQQPMYQQREPSYSPQPGPRARRVSFEGDEAVDAPPRYEAATSRARSAEPPAKGKM